MEREQYDVIIVGGGLAGAAVARVLAAADRRVLVLERETVFRDRVRGEWLAPWGVEEARRLNLLEAFSAAGARPLPALAGRSGKPRPVVSPRGDVPLSFYHPALQEELLVRTEAAGAMVLRGARVTRVVDAEPATVEFEQAGVSRSASARVVVGADGRSSLVRRALGREVHLHRDPRILAGVRLGGIGGDPEVGQFIIREDAGGLVALFPQGDGFGRAYVFVQGADAATFSGESGYSRFIEALVALGVPEDLVKDAYPAGPLAAFVASDSWVQHPATGALALVGDAAGISDPTWGMGLSVALRDARSLTAALLSEEDPARALDQYANERDGYYRTLVTAENLMTELQLSTGPEADRRRKHAMRLWSREPGRVIDLPAMGPDIDVSEEARKRFFGEDVPMEAEPAVAAMPSAALQVADEVAAVAEALLNAVRERDFEALKRLFTPTVRTRALLPGGTFEVHGPDDITDAFVGWFGDVEDFRVLEASHDQVADRLQVGWRVELRWPEESIKRVIEQRAYAKVVDGRIAVLDLLCSGFRPLLPGDAFAERPLGQVA